jgi:hypothetical protein
MQKGLARVWFKLAEHVARGVGEGSTKSEDLLIATLGM